MKSIQERLRNPLFMLNDGEQEIFKKAYDAQRQEAANVIDGLVASLETADNAINASYAQAQAEWQYHDSDEDKCDAIIRDWREKRDCALAAVQGNTEGKS